MTFFVNSYSVNGKSEPLTPYKLERRSAQPDDIVIGIVYTGICHTDLHFADNKWGNSTYPMVPGHEIVGTVESIGDKVTKHRIGDVVAVGCLVDSCRECEHCIGAHEMFCVEGNDQAYNSPERRFPGRFTAGGYSEKIVVPEHFTLKVPTSLQAPELLAGVAPILCAGATMYSPLRQYDVGAHSKVAIAGLGGLGHMGIKLARALGAEVTVVSRTHAKDKEAFYLGATRVVASTETGELESARSAFDLVIDTIPGDHDLIPLLGLVRPYGTLCVVGHVGCIGKQLNTSGLILGNKTLSGSFIAGIEETQDLLDLCGEHKIVSEHRVIPMQKVNEAWTALRKGSVADRFVLDIGEFRAAAGWRKA